MKFFSLVLFILPAFAQPHYGGMNNRYNPGAVGQTNNHTSGNSWWGNGDDMTFGTASFSACGWLSPSTFMLTSNGAAVTTTATNWDLDFYSAQNPNPFLVSIRNLSPFTTKGPVPVAGSWHQLCMKYDNPGALLGISLDGGNWTTTAAATPPTSTTGGLFGLGTPWDGATARLSVWNSLLANGDLTTLYNKGYGLRCGDIAGSTLPTTHLLHCWDGNSMGQLALADVGSTSTSGPSPQFCCTRGTGAWPGVNAANAPMAITPFPDGGSIIPSIIQLGHFNGGSAGNFYEIENNNGAPQKHVVVSGDSLMNALGTSTVAINNATISTFGMVNAMIGPGWHYSVQAFPGWTTTNVIANNAIENGLCGEPWKSNTDILLIGRNDIDAAVSAATIEANIISIVSSRQAAGCKVAIMTITPCTFGGVCNGTTEALKAVINTWILAGAVSTSTSIPGCSQTIWTGGSSGANYVIDSGNETLMATASSTLYYLDGLHYTGNGAYIIGKYVWKFLSLFA